MIRSFILFNLFFGTLVFLYSCSSDSSDTVENTDQPEIDRSIAFYDKGREISQAMQGILLSNVSTAINAGGTAHAVEFCNTRALPLTDSLSKVYNVLISRVSDKNRNPINAASAEELELFDLMKQYQIKDTVIMNENSDNQTVYYSMIKTGMPACIKCHGVPETDIESQTLHMIDSLYPNDKAKNYKLGDFRGVWKIVFE